jgi:hypothetical protein
MARRPMGSAPVDPVRPAPWLFFLVTIIVAIAVAAILAYLGLTGHLGSGIVGEKSPGSGITTLPLVGWVLGVLGRKSGWYAT